MAMSIKDVIMIAVSLMVVAIILPIGLQAINDLNTTALSTLDPSILTLIQVLVPILAIIGIALSYLAYLRSD